MNPNKIVFTFITLTLASSVAHAQGGSSGSHGGDVVACFKGNMAQTIVMRAEEVKKRKNSTGDLGGFEDPIGDDGIRALVGPVELLDLYVLRRETGLDGSKTALVPVPKNFYAGVSEFENRTQS